MTRKTKRPADDMFTDLFHVDRREAIKERTCPMCKKHWKTFRDMRCKREALISGLCQACQDTVFQPESPYPEE